MVTTRLSFLRTVRRTLPTCRSSFPASPPARSPALVALCRATSRRTQRPLTSNSGFGLDSHRTWEALQLGCIPIVRPMHCVFDGVFDDLPVAWLADWAELTEAHLARWRTRLVPMAQPDGWPARTWTIGFACSSVMFTSPERTRTGTVD